MSDDSKRDDETPPKVIAALRKYVKPKLVSEKIFESAAGCSKTDPTGFACSRAPAGGS
jgi:hypothetical protein